MQCLHISAFSLPVIGKTPTMVFLNPGYKVRNLLVLNGAGFACISLVVFLLASQPFYLSDVIGVAPERIGSAIGTLGAVDELVAIVVAPLLGTLNDRINGWAWKKQNFPSGSRTLELVSFFVLGLSLLGYGGAAHNLFPDLWFWRALFAVGVSGCMSIVTVMLHEVNNSDFNWTDLAFWRVPRRAPSERLLEDFDNEETAEGREGITEQNPEDEVTVPPKIKKHGSLSALLGVSTGLGAVFSVLCLLPLPVRLGSWYPDLSSSESLRTAYSILGGFALISGVVVFAFAYDCVKQRRGSGHSPDNERPDATYLELLKEGIEALRQNKKIQLAYVAAFVSRSTTVSTAVFIPLVVYKYYYQSGKCGGGNSFRDDAPLQSNCYEGYVFLAILTGVAQTVALISSPVWGLLVDSAKLGSLATLAVASLFGFVGSFGLCIAGRGSEAYDPRNAGCFVLVSLIGLSQIGTIIASMSIVSSVGQTVKGFEHRVIGSISGLYSLCGGIGILAITIIGGRWSDKWVFGPFFLLGLFNTLLLGVSLSRRN